MIRARNNYANNILCLYYYGHMIILLSLCSTQKAGYNLIHKWLARAQSNPGKIAESSLFCYAMYNDFQ